MHDLNLGSRQRDRVVRVMVLKSGGRGFKSEAEVVSRWTPAQLLDHACKKATVLIFSRIYA